jgi:ribose transport system substrate-binding protein
MSSSPDGGHVVSGRVRRRRFNGIAIGVALLLVAVALTGCGDDDDAGGGGGGDEAGVARARAAIDRYRQVPQFEAPGGSFNAREAAGGKTVWSIPSSSAVPFVANIQRNEREIARQVGVNFTVWPNQGQPAQWVQGMQQAISRRADVIDLLAGINPAAVEQQISAADEEGIPTVVSHLFDPTQPSDVDVAARVDIPYEQAGRLLADWAIWRTSGDANALVVTVNEVPSTAPMVSGIKDEFARNCPGCKLTYTNVTIAEAAQRIQPQVQTALVGDPTINYVLALYDSVEVPGTLAAIRAANASDRVKVATFNGTPAILKMIKDGDIVEMDVGEDIRWIAYAIMDQDLRLLGGLEPVKDPRIGIRVFDDTNIDEAGNPPKDATGYGSSYVQGYQELWQLDE